MIIVVDNTKNLDKAFMTPKLLKCLDNYNVKYKVVSTCEEVIKVSMNNAITGAILSGGPMSVAKEIELSSINKNIMVLLMLDKPVLGICFGFQLMGSCYGGDIVHMENESIGQSRISYDSDSILFKEFEKNIVQRYHQDKLIACPKGFKVTAKSDDGIIQAIENVELKRWGVQFHPEGLESSHSIIRNFVNIL